MTLSQGSPQITGKKIFMIHNSSNYSYETARKTMLWPGVTPGGTVLKGHMSGR